MPSRFRVFLAIALGLALAAGMFIVTWQRPTPIEFQPYTARRLAEHLEAGMCVVVELHADWHVGPALQIHHMSDRVASRMRRAGIAALSADCTEASAETTDLRERYEIKLIPAILIFSPGAPDRPKILLDLVSEQTLLHALDQCASAIRDDSTAHPPAPPQ